MMCRCSSKTMHVYILRDHKPFLQGKPLYEVCCTGGQHEQMIERGVVHTWIEAIRGFISSKSVVVSCDPLGTISQEEVYTSLDKELEKEGGLYVCKEGDERMRGILQVMLGRGLLEVPPAVPKERWSVIQGYEEYEVSSLGRVRKGGYKMMTPRRNSGLRIQLQGGGRRANMLVGKLVLEAFEPRYKGQRLVFKDGKNDNVCLNNLSWEGQSVDLVEETRSFLGLRCPQCKQVLDWKHLYIHGCECSCGISQLRICQEVSMTFGDENCTYFIVEEGRVMYVGTSKNVARRVQEHMTTGNLKDWKDLRISLILGECAMTMIYKPPRNKQNVYPNSVGDVTRLKRDGKWVTWKGSPQPAPSINVCIPENVWYRADIGLMFSKGIKTLKSSRSFCYGRGSTQFVGGSIAFRHKVWPCRCLRDCVTQLNWMRCIGKEMDWKEEKYKEGAVWWQDKMHMTEDAAWELHMAA